MTYTTDVDIRAVLLGSGGWMATRQRSTSCLLVRHGTDAVALDAGTAIATLCQQDSLLDDCQRLDVLISHFHLDHVAGLTYLPALAERLDITVWGPGQLLLERSSWEILSQLVGHPFLSADIKDFAQIREISRGENDLQPFSVVARVQPLHPGGSIGFRLGDSLAYCTDTAPDTASSKFVSGVSCLVHEAWNDLTATAEHSSAASAARTAADARVGHLVLSHVNPLSDDPDRLLSAARPIFPATEVGYDGLELFS